MVPERAALHEVTISHCLGLISRRVPCWPNWPSSKPSVKAKNGFEPSFWSRGQNSFSKSKSPPWVGGRISTRIPSGGMLLQLNSLAMRCTVPVPMPSDLATLNMPTPFASCFRTFRSVALSIFGLAEPHAMSDGALSCAKLSCNGPIRTVCRHCLANAQVCPTVAVWGEYGGNHGQAPE